MARQKSFPLRNATCESWGVYIVGGEKRTRVSPIFQSYSDAMIHRDWLDAFLRSGTNTVVFACEGEDA